eukprot:2065126-Rhodomonas_salina.1
MAATSQYTDDAHHTRTHHTPQHSNTQAHHNNPALTCAYASCSLVVALGPRATHSTIHKPQRPTTHNPQQSSADMGLSLWQAAAAGDVAVCEEQTPQTDAPHHTPQHSRAHTRNTPWSVTHAHVLVHEPGWWWWRRRSARAAQSSPPPRRSPPGSTPSASSLPTT